MTYLNSVFSSPCYFWSIALNLFWEYLNDVVINEINVKGNIPMACPRLIAINQDLKHSIRSPMESLKQYYNDSWTFAVNLSIQHISDFLSGTLAKHNMASEKDI